MKLAKHFGANRNSSMSCLICSSVHSVHCTLYSYRTNVHKLCSASSAKQLNNWSDHIIGGTHGRQTDIATSTRQLISFRLNYFDQVGHKHRTTEPQTLGTETWPNYTKYS